MKEPIAEQGTDRSQRMSLIVTKGTLDWAYPPFTLATTAAAMGFDVSMFFTFYGLPLLLKDLDLPLSSLGNPAMKMPIGGRQVGLPNALTVLPGMDRTTAAMMKKRMASKGIASIEELRATAVESGVRLIACQMTVDLFDFAMDDMIDGVELGGSATYIEAASQAGINLFI